MLKVPEHQVAGHFATETELGPLIDGAGLFYKPLQSSDRGSTELSFYSNPQIPPKIHDRFFPKFHGTTLHNNNPHLIIDDLTSDLTRPSVIDFKIGSRTWSPSDPEPYFEKCIAKDRETASLSLGFRVSGLRIYDDDRALYKPDRSEVQRFDADGVRNMLRRFGKKEVMEGLLEELVELKGWFEEQTIWHFYSASLLVMYEEGKGKPRVKMVDFAHVVDAGGVIDHNFLGGLCSLIKFVKEVIAEFDDGKVDVENGNDIGVVRKHRMSLVSKNQYHCDGCGICIKENFFHCYSCGCCYIQVLKDSHRCVERAMHHNCPICFEEDAGDEIKETLKRVFGDGQ